MTISGIQFGLLVAVVLLNLVLLLMVARERRARLDREDDDSVEQFVPPPPSAPVRDLPRLGGNQLPDEVIRTLAGIAHSLNNRFSAIHSHASLIDPNRLEHEQTHSLETILAEARQGGKLAVNLLDQVVPKMRGRPAPAQDREYDPRKGWHILVVQQHEAGREAVVSLLERDGFHVTVAADGVEAWNLLEQTDVDIIVSGVRMDTLSGRGFFEQLEEKFPTLASRVVFLTGDFARPESREFLDHSGQPIVPKPFEPEELVAAVHSITRRIVTEGAEPPTGEDAPTA